MTSSPPESNRFGGSYIEETSVLYPDPPAQLCTRPATPDARSRDELLCLPTSSSSPPPLPHRMTDRDRIVSRREPPPISAEGRKGHHATCGPSRRRALAARVPLRFPIHRSICRDAFVAVTRQPSAAVLSARRRRQRLSNENRDT